MSRNPLASLGSKLPRNRAAAAALGAKCEICPLRNVQVAPVHSTIPSGGGVYVCVGEGPGANETARGTPFCGHSGELLRRVLAASGIHVEEVFIGNVIRCQFPEGFKDKEKLQAAAACIPSLMEELRQWHPRVVVLLGKTAAAAWGLASSWAKRQNCIHDLPDSTKTA